MVVRAHDGPRPGKYESAAAFGKRLNVPAGSSVRFEPGDSKTVTLVAIGGAKRVVSGNLLTDGIASADRLPAVLEKLQAKGFGHAPSAAPPRELPSVTVWRAPP